MTLWNIYYETKSGNSGTWQEYANSKSEAIAKAREHHRNDLNRGHKFIGASPA